MGRLKLNRRGCAKLARFAVMSAIAMAAAACADNAASPGDGNDIGSVAPPGSMPGVTQPGALAGSGSMVPNVPGGTAGNGAVQPGTGTPSGTQLPCSVNTVVKNRCQTCHAAEPIGGAPMSLVTYEDFHKDHASKTTMPGVTKKVYEWVKIRVNDAMKPMPQGRMLPADELAIVNAWLDKQAPQAGQADACQTDTPTGGTGTTGNAGAGGSTGATGGPGQPGEKSRCDGADAYEPLVARDGETCYDFPVHGQSSPTDTSKFAVHADESYNQFYYAIPWPAGSMATRFGADFDNKQVLHHWLAFSSESGNAPGTVSTDVTGTTLGENTQLIGGWAVGGCNVVFPPEMGLKLPSTGKVMIQWHHYNYTGSPQMDGSKVQMCVLPSGSRPNLGGLTWLGSENIDVQPGQKAETFGTCVNDSNAPITIIAFWPHMHESGINMKSEVQKSGQGSWNTVFDKPFDFNYQVHYTQDPPLVLQPGDSIRSTCTYMNTTAAPIAFGQSTKAEMCYQFAFSYPAGALDNGVISLIGASNTCWQFGE
jgi:hypothetical protein